MIAQSLSANNPQAQSGINDQLSSLLSTFGYLPTQDPATYGLREDGTPKSPGYFGPLPNSKGGVSGELSIEVDFDGKRHLIPSLVPTLDQSEVMHMLNGGRPTPSIVKKAVDFSVSRLREGLSPFAGKEEIPYAVALPSNSKSPAWNAAQQGMNQSAAEAGLPALTGTQEEAPARLRLKDAIFRLQSTGLNIPHFIGTENEPLGDRGVTMDIENLVKGLGILQGQALAAGDKEAFSNISKEREFWKKEAADGMSASEWKKQTGESDPIYPNQ